MSHLTEEKVRSLIQGELPSGERNEAVRHLLTQCAQCVQLAQTVAADADLPYTWGLYETILEAAKQTITTKPEQAIEIADLALTVSTSLAPEIYGERLIADFKAGTLAVRGNCKRVAEDFEGARADLETAWELLGQGTGDALERAKILSLRASWNIDLGFFKEAEELLENALNIYRQASDDSMVGRTMVKQAEAIGYHDPKRAIPILKKASRYIDPLKEPMIELCMRHALAWCLNDTGQIHEALGVLEESRELYWKFRNRVLLFRLNWLEGRIHHNMGSLEAAEEIFERTAADFLESGLLQEYLLCSVDLAGVVFERGDRIRTLQICNSLYSSLKLWHMHAEGIALALLFIATLKEEIL